LNRVEGLCALQASTKALGPPTQPERVRTVKGPEARSPAARAPLVGVPPARDSSQSRSRIPASPRGASSASVARAGLGCLVRGVAEPRPLADPRSPLRARVGSETPIILVTCGVAQLAAGQERTNRARWRARAGHLPANRKWMRSESDALRSGRSMAAPCQGSSRSSTTCRRRSSISADDPIAGGGALPRGVPTSRPAPGTR
jgi:hypothetical protein